MLEQIKQMLETLDVQWSAVQLKSQLGEMDLGLDCLGIITLMCMIEQHFQVKLPQEGFTKHSSIADVIRITKKAQCNVAA